MFIKVTTTSGRRYAQLVESFRNDNAQPRQRTLATLGRLEPGGDVDRLIQALDRAQGRDPSAKTAGVLWGLWQVWRSLDLDKLSLAWPRSRSGVGVLACLRTMVFDRLCDPSSKLGVLRWLQSVELPRGCDFSLGAPDHQQLLRAMHVLEEHADAIEQRLSELMRPLIDQELSVVFYVLTTITVHGLAEVKGEIRAVGHSKDGGVARQVVLSLVQTADGQPLAHQVQPGNTVESHTPLPMIERLVQRWPLKRVVLVADRGLLSLDNLHSIEALQKRLREGGRDITLDYVLAVPAARYGEFTDELHKACEHQDVAQPWVAELAWQHVTKEEEPPSHRLVLCHDPEVAQRRTQARLREIAELVVGALSEKWSGRLDEQDAGQKRRGRPMSDSGAKARLYHAVKDASLAHLIKVDLKSELFQLTIDEERQRYLELLDGKLLLGTSTSTSTSTSTDAQPQEVVQRYKSLANIERGFRTLKSDIEIGPVYHRLPMRIQAHALICFLALVVHRVMKMRLKAAGRHESPTRLLEQLSRIHLQTLEVANGALLQ